jgi:hypothetical protein
MMMTGQVSDSMSSSSAERDRTGSMFQHTSVSRMAIASILQFLQDAGLEETYECLQQETQGMFESDLTALPQGGMLLQALDLLQDTERAQEDLDPAEQEDKEIEALLVRGTRRGSGDPLRAASVV